MPKSKEDEKENIPPTTETKPPEAEGPHAELCRVFIKRRPNVTNKNTNQDKNELDKKIEKLREEIRSSSILWAEQVQSAKPTSSSSTQAKQLSTSQPLLVSKYALMKTQPKQPSPDLEANKIQSSKSIADFTVLRSLVSKPVEQEENNPMTPFPSYGRRRNSI